MTPTATPAAGFVFINGGFEDGTAGWDTYGGEAGTVASPTRSGGAAGLFESSTTSTKWLFQPVRIEGDLAYTFSGYLMPDEGVSEAYLRLSWYASSDASGAAIRSDDSTARAGPGSAFVFLTTGAVVPPADASSARVRVMLAPAGSAPASLYLDDFSFVAGPPPEATATAVAAAPGANAPADEPQSGATPSAVATSDNSTARSAAAPASRTPSPRAASATPKARATAAIEAGLTIPPSSPGSLPPWPLIAGPAAAMALAGGYLLGRRRSE